MLKKCVGLVAAAALLVGCWNKRQSQEVVSGGEVTAAEVNTQTAAVLPEGADLSVRNDQMLSTEKTKVGDRLTLTVWSPVLARSGDEIVPKGARVYAKVTGIRDSNDPTNRALVQLDVQNLEFRGKLYPLEAYITDISRVVERRKSTGEIIQRTGTPVAGTIIGAIIIGPDLDAIMKAGVLGTGVGTVVSLGLGDVEHVIPAGTPMMLRVTETVVFR